MANNTLRDVVVNLAGQGANISNVMSHLTKKSGILKTALAIPANYGIYHKYRKYNALPSFSVGGVTSNISDTTVNKKLETQELAKIHAIQTEYADVCENHPGGVQGFFDDMFLAYIEAWGQEASKNLIYGTDGTFGNEEGTFGFHQIAKHNSKVIQKGGTTGSRSSIFAVKYDPMTCGVLFNPKMAAAGNFLQVDLLHDGKPYPEVINDGGADQNKKIVYGAYYKAWIAFLSASAYDVAAITQIQDDTGDKPLASDMDKVIDYVHGDEGSTFLYMNRATRRLVRELKNSKFELGAMDKNYDVRIDYWNGVPIVTDENISSSETTVLD